MRTHYKKILSIAALIACSNLATFGNHSENQIGWPISVAQAAAVEARQVGQNAPRVALIIGNAHYKQNEWQLNNPINDVNDMTAKLKKLGFETISVTDASLLDMERAIRRFGDMLEQKKAVGLFYYSGHAVQIDGQNYLLPVDFRAYREDEIRYQSMNVNLILDKMEGARNPLNILILDACRDNPGKGTRSVKSRGLAQLNTSASGVLIAFATAPGKTASDGEGRNGLYTKHLLKYIDEPNIKLEDVFKKVRASIRAEAADQIPWENSSIDGDFYFVKTENATSVNANSTSASQNDLMRIELLFWESIKESQNSADFQAYLRKYPSGNFTELAKNRIASLQKNTVSEVRSIQPTPSSSVNQQKVNPPITTKITTAVTTSSYSGSLSEKDLESLMKKATKGDNASLQTLMQAARFGALLPQYYLGLTHLELKNNPEAMKWFRIAASKGFSKAENQIGLMYENARGVPQDFIEAAKWYTKSAQKGDPDGQFNIGRLYERGSGVDRNYQVAEDWYKKAAEQGNNDAKGRLGTVFLKKIFRSN